MNLSTQGGQRLLSPRFAFGVAVNPTHFQPSQLALRDAVKLKLQSGEYNLERSCCPCGQEKAVVISEIDRYQLPLTSVLCADCGTVRIDPYLDEDSLEDFYTRYYQQMYARATNVDDYFVRQDGYGRKILAASKYWLQPGSWVFEVGCGAGGALKAFQDRGYSVAGCDYSAELIEAGRQKAVQNIYYGSLDEIGNRLDGVKANLIYLHHVFEHVNHPWLLLENCRRHLALNGRIIIVVPDISRIHNFTYPAGDLLKFLHIAHKFNFSFKGLKCLGNQVGYVVSRLTSDLTLETSWSHMPELWVEMRVETATAPREFTRADELKGDTGADMLQYLIKTERLHSLGLCPGQFLSKLAKHRSQLSIKATSASALLTKVLRKLKSKIRH